MPASDARPIPLRNTAFRVTFAIFDADGDLVSGAAELDSEISKDAGSFVDCVNESVEIAPSSGMYYLDLTASEMDADTVAVIVKTTTTGAKTTPIVLYPAENTDIPANVRAISDDVTAADNLEMATDGGSYNIGGGGVVAASVAGSVTVGVNNDKTGYSLANGAITAAVIAANAIGADAIASDAVAEIQSGLATASAVATINGLVDDLEARLTATRAGYLDNLVNLDAAVSSRLAASGYTAPANSDIAAIKAKTDNLPASPAATGDIPSPSAIRAEMDANSTKLANLDAAITTRASQASLNVVSGYVDTEVAAIQAVTAKLDTALEADGPVYRFTANALEQAPTGSGGCPTASDIADAVWDEPIAGHLAAGTTGQALNGAGSAGDPWITALPGAYAPGTAGHIVGSRLCTLGPGAISWTYTLTSGVDSSPIADAQVWVTTDHAGGNVVASGYTDAFGKITFQLDAGVYYIWRQKSGWMFANPDMEAVT